MKKTIREKVIEQIRMMEVIQEKANINIVNCGHCGSVILHERFDKKGEYTEEIECPYCAYNSEPCDFPDFLYWGMENSSEFDEPIKKWSYSVSTDTLWTSFDYGEVEATSYEEALEKAKAKLTYDFKKVNEILGSCDPTMGFNINFNDRQIQIEEVNE